METPRLLVSLSILVGLSLYAHASPQPRYQARDSTEIQNLLDQGYALEQSNPDSAIITYQVAIDKSIKSNYLTGAGKAHHYSGIVESERGNYSEAIVHYRKAIDIFRQTKDFKSEAKSWLNAGNVYFMQGIYKESLTHYLTSLKLMEDFPEDPLMSTVLFSLGSTYSSVKEFEKSKQYHKKSLALAESLRDTVSIGKASTNMGVTYQAMGIMDSAEYYFKRALDISNLLQDPGEQYVALNNLSTIYEQRKEYGESLKLARQAREKAIETEDPYMISSATLTLANANDEAGNKTAAMQYINEGLAVAQEYRILENIAMGYIMLTEAQKDMGNYKAALESYKMAQVYSDSLSRIENFREIGRIEGKYDLESELKEKQLQEEKDAAAAQLARERRDRIQYSLIALVVFFLFVGVKLVRNFRVSPKVSQLITLAAVLLFFEFLLVFLDPYVDALSGSIPVYKLGLNLIVAVLIFPIHEWLLRLLTRRSPEPVVQTAG